MNCPFYGHAMFGNSMMPVKILLWPTGGNQCALVTGSETPCWMETTQHEVDWRECPVVGDMRPRVPQQ